MFNLNSLAANTDKFALIIGLCTMIGSIFGGVIASTLVRRDVISGYRQKWINDLRVVFAELLNQADIYTDVSYQNNESAYDEKMKLNSSIVKVKLYLNRKEYLSNELIELIENIPERYFGKNNIKSEYLIEKAKIAELMQDILKNEWNRVRDGEAMWWIKNAAKKLISKF